MGFGAITYLFERFFYCLMLSGKGRAGGGEEDDEKANRYDVKDVIRI
jgi:hypothetical protein